ncbi:tryptophan--tRNA ligase [bacterium BMS3Abin15]|nr:tryptophan--tRNA ligase [bacterium BMS3Abin15]
MKNKDVVLSGIRATGSLHLGNYLGAMKFFAQLSQDGTKDCFFFIANLHTLTTKTDPEDIKRDLKEIVLDYVSIGIDPNVATIFAQSSVPETCELNWLLGCLASMGDLERMPHFKDKKDKKEAKREMVNAGLLTYPVLMAADILGPQANLVPVGEDQYPHVELTRELARRFNTIYGETFPVPDLLSGEAIRVPGLDGTEKMGKSDYNTIDLSDSSDVVRKKMAKAMTDPSRKKRSDPGNPSVCNVYALHTLISSGEELKEVLDGCKVAGIGCVDCKNIIAKNITNILMPIQQKRAELAAKGPDLPLEILHEGGKRARRTISVTVNEVKDKMGVPSY